ncbi:MAG TPA: P-II family nitrogen regulator [Dissulfurispiraceae bacterium]|nr:P-II family nitrogen regulator [Dissulfurispiraceae bacterium]
MKKIEAIVRPTGVRQVCEILEKVGYPGVMISDIEGHGRQRGFRERNVRGVTCKVPFLEKKRIVLVVQDSEADTIIKAIREAACTGKIGDGKIFVSPMDDAIRIRTGETGDAAV